jgi:hypothetical protein
MKAWEVLPPNEQAAHPDTPIDRLRYLAHFHPSEVLKNPILPLLFLEAPEAAAEILLEAQRNFSAQVLAGALAASSEAQRRLWLCDCAERLQPYYETNKPRALLAGESNERDYGALTSCPLLRQVATTKDKPKSAATSNNER